MTAQLHWGEVDLWAELLKERRHGQVEWIAPFVSGEHIRDTRDVNLFVRSLASGQDDDRGRMGCSLAKAQPKCQVIPTEDHDLPGASVLVHDRAPPQQAGLTDEPIRINGDGHPCLPGTRTQPVGEDIYGCAWRHTNLSWPSTVIVRRLS